MVIIKKPIDPSTVKGGIKSIFGAFREEGIEQLKEVKKDVARSFGSEPGGGEKPKSWEDEWLKDKDKDNPPVSDKEGGHSKIDPAGMMKGSDEQALEATRRKIASALNSQYTRASSASDYGKEQAQKYQQEHTPIYDQIKKEEEDRKKQQQHAATQQSGPVGPPSGKPKGRPGKKKHQPSPMELNRAEFRGAKGK